MIAHEIGMATHHLHCTDHSLPCLASHSTKRLTLKKIYNARKPGIKPKPKSQRPNLDWRHAIAANPVKLMTNCLLYV